MVKWSDVKVTQLCPTLCDLMDYTVHGILQARILQWVTFYFSGDFPYREVKPRFHTLQGILYWLSHKRNCLVIVLTSKLKPIPGPLLRLNKYVGMFDSVRGLSLK